jgi:HSP20 family protein
MAWLPWRRPKGQGESLAHPAARFRRDMERAFEDFVSGAWLPESWGGAALPALDMRETESDVIVDVEAPGFKPEEVDISVTDQTLTMRGEKKSETEEKKGDYHVSERSYGSFSRTVKLPAAVDADQATAQHKDGVVTITLPKTEKSKPKKIEVK